MKVRLITACGCTRIMEFDGPGSEIRLMVPLLPDVPQAVFKEGGGIDIPDWTVEVVIRRFVQCSEGFPGGILDYKECSTTEGNKGSVMRVSDDLVRELASLRRENQELKAWKRLFGVMTGQRPEREGI